MPAEIQFKLEATKADFEAEEAAAAGPTGASFGDRSKVTGRPRDPLTRAAFVDPISAVVVTTLAWLSVRLVNHWLTSKEQGVMIDLQEEPPRVSRVAGVPAGFLVVLDKNGRATHHQSRYGKPEEIMPLLTKIFGAAGGG